MHTLELQIEDSKLDLVLNIINNLKDDLITEYTIIKDNQQETLNTTGNIDFSKYNVSAFLAIQDPVKYQKNIRDEWN